MELNPTDIRIDQLGGANRSLEGLSQFRQNKDPDLSLSEERAEEIAKEFGIAGSGDFKGNFSDLITKTLDKVNQDQIQADSAIKEMVAGRNKNIHETMLAVEKADLSLKLMMQVRNKVLDAYREVMRMQV